MKILPIIVMGITSILMQITVLRRLMSVFSGNELDIGITLSVWLTAVGIGSYAGHRFRNKNAFALSFLLIALLSQSTILGIDLIRPVFLFEMGETISLTVIVISTVISISLFCFIVGAQFPMAVSYLKSDSAWAYSLEAIGAFIGGVVFTLFLSNRVNAYVLSSTISVINVLMAIILFRKRYLIVFFIIPLILYFGIDRIKQSLQWKDIELIEQTESRYGEITVLKLRDQLNIYSSGRFHFSYPDIQVEELKAHMPITFHPQPSQILIIGGSPAVLREILRYHISSIDFVEIDPEMIKVSMRHMTKNDKERLTDKRIKIITMDARRFVKGLNRSKYDMVILNLAEPSTANINRFYTIDFFKEAKAVLRDGGLIFLNLPAAYGYVGKSMQMANGSIYNSLRDVFRYVAISSEEYGIMIGSDSLINTDPEVLSGRFTSRISDAGYFHPYILSDAFSPLKVNMFRERLSKVNSLNEDMRPVSYLYNLMLWAEMHGGNVISSVLEHRGKFMISVIVLIIILSVFLFGRKQVIYFSIFTTGYSAMAFSMIIILSYQAAFGYVYEMIGLITAIFMLGIALGAYGGKSIKSPLRWFRFFEVLTIILLISFLLSVKEEFLFYVLSLLAGIIAGVEFATATKSIKEDNTVMIAGRLYAFDLAGSFLGAFLTAVFLVPSLGIQNTIFAIILIKAASLVLLSSLGYEET